MFKKDTFYNFNNRAGFTLVELLVSLSIIIILSSVVVWNQSAATKRVNISNATNELLVRLREAQTYGVSVKVVETNSGVTFDAGYGIHLDFDQDYILLFADKDGDRRYDGDGNCTKGPSHECLDKFVFVGGVKIIDMCGLVGNSSNDKCTAEHGASLDALDIVYQRPTPGTDILFLNNGGNSPEGFTGEYVNIKLGYERGGGGSPLDPCRSVLAYGTGQITASGSCE